MSTEDRIGSRVSRHRRKVGAGVFGLALLASGVLATTAEADDLNSGDPRATAFHGNNSACPAGTQLLSAPNGGNLAGPLVSGTITNGSDVATKGGQYLRLTFVPSMTGAVVTVYVKGSNAYNQYLNTTVGTTPLTLLHSPLNSKGSIPAVSHYLVCQTTEPPVTPRFDTPPGIHVAYADDFHAVGGGAFPFLPTPWKGDPSVVYIGCSGASECGGTGTGKFDSGAIRIDNQNAAAPLELMAATVNIGPCTFNPWPALLPATAGVGQRFVLTQSGVLGPPTPGTPPAGSTDAPQTCAAPLDPQFWAETNFDTSERPGDTRTPSFYDCNPGVRHKPVINLTFKGATGDVNLTVVDEAMVLNTGGTDSFACRAVDEAAPWTGPIPYSVP